MVLDGHRVQCRATFLRQSIFLVENILHLAPTCYHLFMSSRHVQLQYLHLISLKAISLCSPTMRVATSQIPPACGPILHWLLGKAIAWTILWQPMAGVVPWAQEQYAMFQDPSLQSRMSQSLLQAEEMLSTAASSIWCMVIALEDCTLCTW